MQSTTTREEFRALAAEHRVVPVTRKVLADSETPLSAYRKLAANRPGTFLLESAENGRSWSRWSFIGAGAPSALTIRDGHAVWLGHTPTGAPTGGDPLQALQQTIELLSTGPLAGVPPLSGGMVGYFAYDFVRRLERLPELAVDDLQLPDMLLLLATDLAAVDHHEGTITLIANARYLLMSCALAQKFAPGTPFFHRLIIGYDVTDELFGITIARPGYLNPFYTYGAIALAAPAWAMGTALGIIAGNLLPVRVVSALSVALYGMFLAIIIPPARKNRVVAVLVMLSFALSFACGCLPGIASLSDGTRTILLTVLISCGAAVLFPVTPEAPETAGTEEVQA